MSKEHPFVPGARVAIHDRFGDGMREGFVEKVYKTGNFTLRGSSQQWRPWDCSWSQEKRWSATSTGSSGWDRRRLDLWDETTDKEISDKIAASLLKDRWNKLRRRVEAVKGPTVDFCDAVDKALNVLDLTSGQGKP